MVFENIVQFREAVAKYDVVRGVALRLRPNDVHRVKVTYKKETCDWHLHASVDGNTKDFTLKTLNLMHKCGRTNKNKLCTLKFITNFFKERVLSQPSIKLWQL